MLSFWDNPLSIILLCIIAYKIGLYIYAKTNLAIFNPLFIAIFLIIMFLQKCGAKLRFSLLLCKFSRP